MFHHRRRSLAPPSESPSRKARTLTYPPSPPSQKYFFCASRFFFSDPFPNPNPIAATQLAAPFGPRLPPRRSAKRFAFVLPVSQPLRLLRRHRPFAYAHSFGLWPHPAHLPRAVRPRYRVSARPPPWLIITQPTPPNTTPPHYPYHYYLPKPSARSLRRVAPRSPSPHTPSLPHRYLLQPLHPLLRLHPRPLPRPTPPPAILPFPRIHQHHLKLHIATLRTTHSHRLRRCLIPLLRQPSLPRPRRTPHHAFASLRPSTSALRQSPPSLSPPSYSLRS